MKLILIELCLLMWSIENAGKVDSKNLLFFFYEKIIKPKSKPTINLLHMNFLFLLIIKEQAVLQNKSFPV